MPVDQLKMATDHFLPNLEHRGEKLLLAAELRGFEKDDIHVRVPDRTLRLKARHEEETEEGAESEYIRRERRERKSK